MVAPPADRVGMTDVTASVSPPSLPPQIHPPTPLVDENACEEIYPVDSDIRHPARALLVHLHRGSSPPALLIPFVPLSTPSRQVREKLKRICEPFDISKVGIEADSHSDLQSNK